MTEKLVPSLLGTGDESNAEETARFIAELSTPTDDQRALERASTCRPVTLYVDDATWSLRIIRLESAQLFIVD